jgi:MurNAc alpha-1-phosphate uridylyltransferase
MSFVPKSAFVLAAGLGIRMRPLTDAVPKPLVGLTGRTLIDHVLDRLADAGVKRAVVNVHYLAGQIEHHLAKRTRPQIFISDERDALLDTGGGAVRALPKLGAEPFVIHNSDSVWIEGAKSNLARLFAAWDTERMDSLMLLAPVSSSVGYDGEGDFEMDISGRLTRRESGRTAPFVFAGVSIAHPRLFAGAPEGAFSLNWLWSRAIEQGRLYGVELEGTWMHVGTPEALAEAESHILQETVGH